MSEHKFGAFSAVCSHVWSSIQLTKPEDVVTKDLL